MGKRGNRNLRGNARRATARALTIVMALSAAFPAGAAVPKAEGGVDMAYGSETDEPIETADFAKLREKWKVLLTGDEHLSQAGQLAEDYAAYVDELAGELWESMIKQGDKEQDDRTCLFEDLPLTNKKDKTGSSQITLTFDRLKAIVLAYETPGSSYYQNEPMRKEIIAALDLMIRDHYSLYYACGGTGTGLGSGNHSFGNWYDWRIGTPRQLCDLLLMFSDELTEEQIDRYTAPIIANNKKVDTTGANRTWIANIFIQTGILRGDGELVEAGKAGVKDVFKYVTSKDGFYKDGSFVQHNNYAYTGGYGKALLCTMAPMMYVLNGTEYAIAYEDNCQQMFFDMIFEAYEPLIYGGRFMDMAREREISRVANQDSIPGRQAIRSIIMLLDVMPQEQRERGYRMVKEWLSDEEVLAQVCIDIAGGYNEYYLPAGVIQMAVDIAESDIEPRGSLVTHKRYGGMDRVVHLREDFGFTVSMSSKRIYNTEGTNDEGLRLWHIGDGLTYLYNADKSLYSDHYWATVDYQRLPGTTVNRVPGRAPKAGYGTENPYDFAGGTDLGEYGIAGMELQGVGDTKRNGAHSRKSWFMFDDEVAAVGSDIRSTLDNSPVETIVENRKIALDKSNKLTVNGVEQEFESGGDPYEEENKSIQVTTVTKAGGKDVKAKVDLSGTEQKAQTITFSCSIKLPQTNDFFALKLYGTPEHGGAEKNLMFLSMRDGSMVPRMSDNKDAYSSDAALKAGTWHQVKAELDLKTQTMNYYFDGQQIKKGVSTGANTTDADLVNAPFYAGFTDAELAGGGIRLSGFEIMTPGNGTGTICVDDISILCGEQELFAENFEDDAEGTPDASVWTVTKNDTGKGAGAEVVLEKEQIIPEGTDDFNGTHEDTEWIHLAGSAEGTDVGYYFPGKASVEGLRETRKGSWNQVNTYEKFTDDEERMNSFVTFWFDHGTRPSDASYAYVVLPGRTAGETAEYNENPDVEILSQTDAVHAVKEKKLGITGINFFEAGSWGPITVEQPSSVMLRENEDGTADISFSDPTQTCASVKLRAALPITEVVSMDEGITAKDENGLMVFTAEGEESPRAQAGKSWHVTVKLGGNDNMFETIEPGVQPEHWTVEDGSALVAQEDGGHVLEISPEAGKTAMAQTGLLYPEEGGSMVRFQIFADQEAGDIYIGDEEEQIRILSFGDGENPLEPGVWHDIRVKVNQDTGKLQVMADGALYGEPKAFSGSLETFTAAVAGGKLRLDNLIVRPASVTAPPVPEHLTYTAYGDTWAELSWDPVESDGPVYYIVSVNGEDYGEPSAEAFRRVDGLEPGETYVFTVRSTDDNDNISEPGKELELTVLEEQNSRYVINFDQYQAGESSQNGWSYAGSDPKGVIRVEKAPGVNTDTSADGLMTDLEYRRRLASASNALSEDEELATASNASVPAGLATPSDASTETDGGWTSLATPSDGTWTNLATASNAQMKEGNQALYVYSGTSKSGVDKNAYYVFDKQTKKQTYELDVYLDESVKYTNFNLVGSDGKQAVTVMISDGGVIGYRAGDAPKQTVELLDEPVEDQWIHFVITADPQTQTFSIAANGAEKENLKFRYGTPDITKLTVNAPASAIGGIYVDNIILPSDEEFGKWILTGLEEAFDEELEAPWGTSFDELGLPEYVNVAAIDPDGDETFVEVRMNWNRADYDGEKAGRYTIQGTLALPSNYTSRISDKELRAKVTVGKKIPVYTVTLEQTAGGTIEADAENGEEGSFVTLTAEPDEGYEFAYWLINGRKKGAGELVYAAELTEDLVVSAVFGAEEVKPETKYYQVKAPGQLQGGEILVSSSYAKEGTEIVVTAVAGEGYKLSWLKVNGRAVQTDEDGEYTFVLEKDTVISASFERTRPDRKPSESGDSDSDEPVWTTQETAYEVSGTWTQQGDSWQFIMTGGRPAVSCWVYTWNNNAYQWFHFNAKGMMETGWITINGQTFYLNPVSDGNRGAMATGWKQIDGKWYWFNPVSDGNRGVLLKNAVTPDGYRVGADGAWIQ